jgi:hypothetical protein
MDAANGGAGVLIGSRGDCACVQHDHFGFISGGSALKAMIEQLPLDSGAVGLGSAASEILHMVRRHVAIILSQSTSLLRGQLQWV